jgi:excisionase family DNA binding protein
MTYVGTAEAAELLGASARRVRDLVASGGLAGTRIAGRWLVDADALEARVALPPLAIRPMSMRVAWAAAAMADGIPAPWLAPSETSRLRRRIEDHRRHPMVWRGWLRGRGEVVDRLRLAETERAAFLADRRVVLTGISTARDHGLDLRSYGADDDVYVRPSEFPALQRAYGLVESERPNLTVRIAEVVDIVESPDFVGATARRGAATGLWVVPTAIAAVDLLESADARSRQAAAGLLRRVARRSHG